MKLDCVPLCSQIIKQKRKKNLTSIESNMKHKGVFIVRGSLHVSVYISCKDSFGEPNF